MVLPDLRDDLRLLPGPRDPAGAPGYLLFDPVQNRYFALDWHAYEMLTRWSSGDPERMLGAVYRQTMARPTIDQVAALTRFLIGNGLVRDDSETGTRTRTAKLTATHRSLVRKGLHSYLFFRIPLVRPDRFLSLTLPWVEIVFSPTLRVGLLGLGVIGLYLTVRQWEVFLSTFQSFYSLGGILAFGAALTVCKVLHELGHAYTAKRYGCRVPTMGVAFMLLWPILYTDTGDAWRLTDRWQRVHIAVAGLAVELSLAMLATFLWAFLPEGPGRSAAFLIATVSWVTSLAVNLNPFMRFDGYYLLADGWGIANLQPRAFALGRWWLRETLFGFGDPAPEPLEPRRRSLMILYAYATWVYRFILFLGIALLVYTYAFKLLGIALMIIELGWFIVLPVARETADWWRRRHTVRLNTALLRTSLLLIGLGVLVTVPWQSWVAIPALEQPGQKTIIYPPFPARILAIDVERGQEVASDAVLARLAVPELDHQLIQTTERIILLTTLIRRHGADSESVDQVGVLQEELAASRATLDGLRALQAQLMVRAPLAGTVVDLGPDLRSGVWVTAETPLARLVADDRTRYLGLVDGDALHRIVPGAPGWFVPEDPARSTVPVRVSEVDLTNVVALDQPYLASAYGGGVAVQQDDAGRLIPTVPQYRVWLEPADPAGAPPRVVRGTVHIEADARSWADRLWRSTLAVLIRESGF